MFPRPYFKLIQGIRHVGEEVETSFPTLTSFGTLLNTSSDASMTLGRANRVNGSD
jgi:hypothetical protein